MPKKRAYSEKTLVRMTSNRFKELVFEIRDINIKNKFFTDAFGTEDVRFTFDVRSKKDLQILFDSLINNRRPGDRINKIFTEILTYYNIHGYSDDIIIQANNIVQVGLILEEIST